LTGGGIRVAAQRKFGVRFGFEDECAGGFWILLVGGAKSGEGAGEVLEGVLTDSFDEGIEGDAGIAEEMAEIGRRDGGELSGEIGELAGLNAIRDGV